MPRVITLHGLNDERQIMFWQAAYVLCAKCGIHFLIDEDDIVGPHWTQRYTATDYAVLEGRCPVCATPLLVDVNDLSTVTDHQPAPGDPVMSYLSEDDIPVPEPPPEIPPEEP